MSTMSAFKLWAFMMMFGIPLQEWLGLTSCKRSGKHTYPSWWNSWVHLCLTRRSELCLSNLEISKGISHWMNLMRRHSESLRVVWMLIIKILIIDLFSRSLFSKMNHISPILQKLLQSGIMSFDTSNEWWSLAYSEENTTLVFRQKNCLPWNAW